MLTYKDFSNKDTLNIFTDASVYTSLPNRVSYSCSGAIAVYMNNIIDSSRIITTHSTNSHGEIMAVSLGLDMALKYKETYPNINIISDSIFCVKGLREWMDSWIRNSKNGKLYNSQMKEVSHQNIFLSMVSIIVYNKLKVNFIHCKGHVESEKDLLHARDVFDNSNRTYLNYQGDIELELIKAISYYNNYVDNYTRENLLNNNYLNYNYDTSNTSLLQYDANRYNHILYKQLIKGRKYE